jgi:hypothetical protein
VTIIGPDAEGQWYAQGFCKPVPRSDLRALLGEMGIDVRKCLWLTSMSSVPRFSSNGWLGWVKIGIDSENASPKSRQTQVEFRVAQPLNPFQTFCCRLTGRINLPA